MLVSIGPQGEVIQESVHIAVELLFWHALDPSEEREMFPCRQGPNERIELRTVADEPPHLILLRLDVKASQGGLSTGAQLLPGEHLPYKSTNCHEL